jgi:hypothetical protein
MFSNRPEPTKDIVVSGGGWMDLSEPPSLASVLKDPILSNYPEFHNAFLILWRDVNLTDYTIVFSIDVASVTDRRIYYLNDRYLRTTNTEVELEKIQSAILHLVSVIAGTTGRFGSDTELIVTIKKTYHDECGVKIVDKLNNRHIASIYLPFAQLALGASHVIVTGKRGTHGNR